MMIDDTSLVGAGMSSNTIRRIAAIFADILWSWSSLFLIPN